MRTEARYRLTDGETTVVQVLARNHSATHECRIGASGRTEALRLVTAQLADPKLGNWPRRWPTRQIAERGRTAAERKATF